MNTKGWLNIILFVLCAAIMVMGTSCAKKPDSGIDEHIKNVGSLEVTAKLIEIPGELRDDPMYDYVHVMKYKILKVHRGQLDKDIVYIGHYNPAKPRNEAADEIVTGIGGSLKKFHQEDVHRIALEVPIADFYMGGIINKYFGQHKEPVYWAVWTNLVIE